MQCVGSHAKAQRAIDKETQERLQRILKSRSPNSERSTVLMATTRHVILAGFRANVTVQYCRTGLYRTVEWSSMRWSINKDDLIPDCAVLLSFLLSSVNSRQIRFELL